MGSNPKRTLVYGAEYRVRDVLAHAVWPRDEASLDTADARVAVCRRECDRQCRPQRRRGVVIPGADGCPICAPGCVEEPVSCPSQQDVQ